MPLTSKIDTWWAISWRMVSSLMVRNQRNALIVLEVNLLARSVSLGGERKIYDSEKRIQPGFSIAFSNEKVWIGYNA